MLNSTEDARPGLAILSNSLPPYRIHLHRLIAARITELKLHSLVSHGAHDFKWDVDAPAEIHVTHFGAAHESPVDGPLRRPWSEWSRGTRLIQYLRENDVRAVIFNGYRYSSYARVLRYCHRAGIPAFLRNDSNIRNEPRHSPLKQFVKDRIYSWWMKRVSGVMSMGTLGDQFFLKYGANPSYLYRVPCWPDFDSFARVDPVELARFRRKFGLSEQRRYFLFSGRLMQIKRVDLLIDAFAAVAEERRDWDLLTVGEGALGNELRARVPESLRSRVIWTGFLDREEPALAYHAADVLVLPSDREAWSLVVQEAMAAGLVVVSSDVPGAPHDLMEDGRSGRIFPKGDLAELRRALLQVSEAGALPLFKERSRAALVEWKKKSEPIAEIRRALADVGVLGGKESRGS